MQVGARLGAYLVQEHLGEGAMGDVYRAYHEVLGRMVAVKVLHALGTHPDAIARFRREAQATAQLRHPGIVTLFDYGELEGAPYMIVEYLPGGSLQDRLREGGHLGPGYVIGLLQGVAAALDYAHGMGIVHRDIKPANILLTAEGNPILADFGIAKLRNQSPLTMAGTTAGTPAFMSPEQAMGKEVGPASDQYSLAVMAYLLLTGTQPFRGDAMQVIYCHATQQPDLPSSRNPELGAEVDAVLMKGLAKDPALRWPGCSAMVTALDQALSVASDARPRGRAAAEPDATRPLAPAVAEAAAAATRPLSAAVAARVARERPPEPAAAVAPASEAPTRTRHSWLVEVGVVLAVVGLIGGLAYLVTRPAAPSVSASRTAVQPGDTVEISAHNLPPGQAVQMFFDSRATPIGSGVSDPVGDLRTTARVPADATPGEHRVLLCWSGQCPSRLSLQVGGG